MIGYLRPNRTLRESTVTERRRPIFDWGYVRPNLSGCDRGSLAMGGTRTGAVRESGSPGWQRHAQPAGGPSGAAAGGLNEDTHANSEPEPGTAARAAGAGRGLLGGLLRGVVGQARPGVGERGLGGFGGLRGPGAPVRQSRMGEPGRGRVRVRGGAGGGGAGRGVAAGPHRRVSGRAGAGLAAERRQPAGAPDHCHASRVESDPVLPIDRGEPGTRRCASRAFTTPTPIARRTTT